MPWYKPKDKEPSSQDEEYFIRNIGDKYLGWWDNKEKEFYMMGEGSKMIYLDKRDYPNIEWFDETEPDQNVLWLDAKEIVHKSTPHAYLSVEAIELLKKQFILSRK